jgi:hypothetical protein
MCALQGYAMPLQIARGLHIRLYARAFVFAEHSNSRCGLHDDACTGLTRAQRTHTYACMFVMDGPGQ